MPSQAEIRDYLERSGDDAFAWRYPLAEFKGGWFNYFVHDGPTNETIDFVIFQAYGNHKRIAEEARKRAEHLNCDRIVFGTSRNGEALARLCGGKVIGFLVELPLRES